MWVGHVTLAIGGGLAVIWAPGLAWKAVATLVSAFGFIGIGTFGHTGSHGTACASPAWNRVLFFLSYPMFLQLSAAYWRYSHIVVHHPSPNVVGVDDDCDLRPLFGLNTDHLRTLSSPFSRWPVLQGLVLPLVLPFNGFNIIRQGWTRLLWEIFRAKRRDLFAWMDLFCLCAHLVLFVGLPMLFFPPGQVLLVYGIRVMLVGAGLFAVLAPGHYPAEAVCMSADQKTAGDYFLRQGAATVNFRTGAVGRFLCCGLEYQIEHHFFPNISPLHYRQLSTLVRKFCRESGIPYRTLGWGEAIWASWRTFFQPKPVLDDIETARSSVSESTAKGRR